MRAWCRPESQSGNDWLKPSSGDSEAALESHLTKLELCAGWQAGGPCGLYGLEDAAPQRAPVKLTSGTDPSASRGVREAQ